MKLQYVFAVLFSVLFYSCDSDLTDIGSNIKPEGDAIILEVDSFGLNSENIQIPYLYSRPDSLLLGTFYDDEFGTLNADILTQFQPPVGVKFPSNCIADSAKLVLRYLTAFGDRFSPVEINVFKMDQGRTFTENGVYQTNIDPSYYASQSVKIGSKTATVSDYGVERDDTSSIIIKLSDSFVAEFNPIFKNQYTSANVNSFHDAFNGIYITPKFGSAALFNIRRIYMRYYFHFEDVIKTSDGLRDSTTIVVNHYQDYPATEEVRTVNRILMPRKDEVFNKVNQQTEYNVVSSPANIYTRVNLSLADINSKLRSRVGNKTLLLNRAMFRVNVTDVSDATLALPLVSTMLLINEDSIGDRFKKRNVPETTYAVIGTIAYEYDANDNLQYYYNFDLSKILTTELAKEQITPELKFRLIPVAISYTGSSTVKDVKEQSMMSAVKICSGTNGSKPMKLQLVYSGF